MEQLLERSSWSVIHPSAYFIVGFIVFLFVALLVVSLCKAAARGDKMIQAPTDFRTWDEPWAMTGMGREGSALAGRSTAGADPEVRS